MAGRARSRRGQSRRAVENRATGSRPEHEVQAYVEARLLGIRLLTLRAEIVTGTPALPAPLFAALPDSPPASGLQRSSPNGESDVLVRAIDLVQQSSSTLQQLPGPRIAR